MVAMTDFRMRDAASMVSSLASSVTTSFGPLAREKLLVSATNKVIITSSGASILASLVASHPVMRWLLDAVAAHVQRAGDGASAFVLFLRGAIEEVERQLSQQPVARHAQFCQQLARALSSLQQVGAQPGQAAWIRAAAHQTGVYPSYPSSSPAGDAAHPARSGLAEASCLHRCERRGGPTHCLPQHLPHLHRQLLRARREQDAVIGAYRRSLLAAWRTGRCPPARGWCSLRCSYCRCRRVCLAHTRELLRSKPKAVGARPDAGRIPSPTMPVCVRSSPPG